MDEASTGEGSGDGASVRQAAHAGSFYPADPEALRGLIDDLSPEVEPDDRFPKALIAPHAGYVYSGLLAARAYALLRPARERIERVVIAGPAHRVPIEGLALPGVDAFATPLGEVPVDASLVRAVEDLPQVTVSQEAHAREHSLEVHLPFLQVALDGFSILPLVVGDALPEEVAIVLDAIWGGPETLIVASSDLSHHLPYDDAMKRDRATARRVLGGATDLIGSEACGSRVINGLNQLLEPRDLSIAEIGRMNSGDGPDGVHRDRERVVGYGAWAYYDKHFRH